LGDTKKINEKKFRGCRCHGAQFILSPLAIGKSTQYIFTFFGNLGNPNFKSWPRQKIYQLELQNEDISTGEIYQDLIFRAIGQKNI
jgi:hypothetical protein